MISCKFNIYFFKIGWGYALIEVYFTRPGNEQEIMNRIKLDVQYAKRRVLIAQNYLSDGAFKSIVEECSVQKLVVLDNRSSLVTFKDKDYVVFLGHLEEDVKSLMHHKFLIIDDIVWAGSLNTSGNAGSHWDQMMRISDEEVVNDFLVEFKKMYLLGKALGQKNIEPSKCVLGCSDNIKNPINHYQISVGVETIRNRITIDTSEGTVYSYYERENIEWNLHCKHQDPLIDYRKSTRCESCKELINNGTINKLEFFNTEYGDKKCSSIQFLCLECLYDSLDDINSLNLVTKPEPVEANVSNLTPHINQEVIVKGVKLMAACTSVRYGLEFTVTKNSQDLVIFVPKKVGFTQEQLDKLMHKDDILNLIGKVTNYQGQNRLVINNPNDIDVIWSGRQEYLREIKKNMILERDRLDRLILKS